MHRFEARALSGLAEKLANSAAAYGCHEFHRHSMPFGGSWHAIEPPADAALSSVYQGPGIERGSGEP